VHKLITATLLILLIAIGCQTNTITVVENDIDKPIEPADNSYCYVCHINYKSEDIAAQHEKQGVGCESCHGMSDNHSSDENGLTAPDRMFAKDKIRAYCTSCHREKDLRKVEMHRQFVFMDKTDDRKGCTDCHGKHRLENRTRKWNKDTGALVWKDGAPVMDRTEGY
jgi:hypothetical protein